MFRSRLGRMAALVPVLLLAAACKVTLLDAYNKDSEDALLRTYGEIESLYDAIGEGQDSAARAYPKFAPRYADIQRMIRVQVLREGARPLNSESFGIISIIDTVFTGYREHHRTHDVPPVLLTRRRDNMKRLFGAALRAERVKQDQQDN
jgi:hypothetical protein